MKRTTIWRETFQQQKMPQPRTACTNFHSIADLVSSHKPEDVKRTLAQFSGLRDVGEERSSSPEGGEECESRRRHKCESRGSPEFHHSHRRDSGSPGSQTGVNDGSPTLPEHRHRTEANSFSSNADDSHTESDEGNQQNTSADQTVSEPSITPPPLDISRDELPETPRSHESCDAISRESKNKKLDESTDGTRGRKGRTIYKAQQVYVLEQIFSRTHYPDPEVIETLSKDLDISENKIKVWFQNKRARWRRRAAETGQQPPSALPPAMLMMTNSPVAAAAAANATATAAGLLPWSPHSNPHPLLMPHPMFHPGYHPHRHLPTPMMTSHSISMTTAQMPTSLPVTHAGGLSPLYASIEARSASVKAPLPTYGLPPHMLPFWHDTHKINVT